MGGDCVTFMFQFDFVTTTLLTCVGLCANSLMLMVLHTRLRRNGANFLLKLLALTYNTLLVCSWAYVFLFRKWHYFRSCEYYCHLAMKWVQILWRAANFSAIWMVVYVVMCRFKVANHPLRTPHFLSHKVIFFFVSLILLVAFIFRIPEIFHYDVTTVDSTNGSHVFNVYTKNLTKYTLRKAYENEPVYNSFKFIERSVVTGVVPAVLLMVYGIRLFRKTRQDSARCGERLLREEMEVSHVIVAAATIFILCYAVYWSSGLLSLIMSVIGSDQLDFEKTCNARIYYCIAYDGIQVNTLSPLFLGLVFRRNLRKQLVEMARCSEGEPLEREVAGQIGTDTVM